MGIRTKEEKGGIHTNETLSQVTNGLVAQTYYNDTFMRVVGQMNAEQARISANGGIIFVSLFVGIPVLMCAAIKVYEKYFSKREYGYNRDNVIILSMVIGLVLAAIISLAYIATAFNTLQVQHPEYFLLKSTVYHLWQMMG